EHLLGGHVGDAIGELLHGGGPQVGLEDRVDVRRGEDVPAGELPLHAAAQRGGVVDRPGAAAGVGARVGGQVGGVVGAERGAVADHRVALVGQREEQCGGAPRGVGRVEGAGGGGVVGGRAAVGPVGRGGGVGEAAPRAGAHPRSRVGIGGGGRG